MKPENSPNEIKITWDEKKNRLNKQKHRISFEEAATVSFDSLSSTIPDPEHSATEKRILIIGESDMRRLMVVSFKESPGEIRIISARKPEPREREDYEENY